MKNPSVNSLKKALNRKACLHTSLPAISKIKKKTGNQLHLTILLYEAIKNNLLTRYCIIFTIF